ncbi:hypothetical protein YC2023_077650 [Brassica napus]
MIGLKLEDGQRFDHLQALANTNLEPPTASSNKTPDVDSQSILPTATVSYTVHVPRRAEEVDEAMPSFENEEKRHVSDCFKSIKPSSPLSLCPSKQNKNPRKSDTSTPSYVPRWELGCRQLNTKIIYVSTGLHSQSVLHVINNKQLPPY